MSPKKLVRPMKPTPDDVWLPLKETRQLFAKGGFDRSDSHIRKMGDQGILPCKRDGNDERRYSFLGVLAWLKERRRIAHERAKERARG